MYHLVGLFVKCFLLYASCHPVMQKKNSFSPSVQKYKKQNKSKKKKEKKKKKKHALVLTTRPKKNCLFAITHSVQGRVRFLFSLHFFRSLWSCYMLFRSQNLTLLTRSSFSLLSPCMSLLFSAYTFWNVLTQICYLISRGKNLKIVKIKKKRK